MAKRKNQRLLGLWPSDPWADPDYWARVNRERVAAEIAAPAPEVDWDEVRAKYESPAEDQESFDPFLYGADD